jgi:hypothetical protein
MKQNIFFLVVLTFLCLLVGLMPVVAQAPAFSHVQIGASSDTGNGASSAVKTVVTSSVNVKATPGNLYGFYALNGAASTCWVQFINSATAGTIGTGVIASFPLPASTTTPVYLPFDTPVGGFSAGIAVGIATTATGATPCGTGGNLTVIYK